MVLWHSFRWGPPYGVPLQGVAQVLCTLPGASLRAPGLAGSRLGLLLALVWLGFGWLLVFDLIWVDFGRISA